VGFVELIEAEWDHANEGQPQQDAIEDFPAGVGPYLAGIEGYFEKVQDDRQVGDLMREEPYCAQLLALTVTVGVDRTYGFITAEFDEGVKKRTDPGEAEGHFGILWISGNEDFDMALKGLDDGKYHFLKVWIQEIGLLLKIAYLRKEGTGTLSELSPSRHAYSHLLSPPRYGVASTLIWSSHQMDPGSGRAKGGSGDSQGTIHASRISWGPRVLRPWYPPGRPYNPTVTEDQRGAVVGLSHVTTNGRLFVLTAVDDDSPIGTDTY